MCSSDLRYVFDKKLLDIETAVYKCTGLPAKEFGIENRGMIREGYFADVLLMDAPNFTSLKALREANVRLSDRVINDAEAKGVSPYGEQTQTAD